VCPAADVAAVVTAVARSAAMVGMERVQCRRSENPFYDDLITGRIVGVNLIDTHAVRVARRVAASRSYKAVLFEVLIRLSFAGHGERCPRQRSANAYDY
jgi:hypothetical protein